MKIQKTEGKNTRRDFLKLASVSAPAAIAAVAVSGTQATAMEPVKITNGLGLQDTLHTRAYLKSLRF